VTAYGLYFSIATPQKCRGQSNSKEVGETVKRSLKDMMTEDILDRILEQYKIIRQILKISEKP
jgi:hypothetical protein